MKPGDTEAYHGAVSLVNSRLFKEKPPKFQKPLRFETVNLNETWEQVSELIAHMVGDGYGQ